MHTLGCRVHGSHPDLGRLFLRLSLGLVFVAHGWMKLSDVAMANAFMEKLGMPTGTGAIIGLVELLGGLAVLVGSYVHVASILLALVMVGAIVLVKGKMGYVGGFEFDLSLLLSALALAKLGAGGFSVDAKRGGCSCGSGCGPLDKGCCGSGACGSGACEMPERDEHLVVVEEGEIVAVEEPRREQA